MFPCPIQRTPALSWDIGSGYFAALGEFGKLDLEFGSGHVIQSELAGLWESQHSQDRNPRQEEGRKDVPL